MHDVDRTLREFEGNEAEFETLEAETGENEQFLGDILGGIIGGEMETSEAYGTHENFLGETGEFETQQFLGEAEAVFDEVQEMELAGELLEVANEAELEYFLGNLIKSAGKAIGGFVKGPVGKALGGALKGIAKKALPVAGAALGNLVLPGVGGAIGGKLASAAGNMFGLELEGLSPQDREFEVAKRFVRFAGAAAGKAARAPQQIPAPRVVRTAIVTAARRHAPGILQPRHYTSVRRRPVTSAPRTIVSAPAQPTTIVQNVPGAPQSPIFRGAISGGTNVYAPTVSQPYTVPAYDTPSYVDDGYTSDGGYTPYARTGRWYRRGRRIVLVGA
jgi:hypothetical protein